MDKADTLVLAGRRGRRWRSSRRWNSVQTKSSLTLSATPERLVQFCLDYEHWSERFPEAVRTVQLVRENKDRFVVRVDHGDGPALGVLKRLSECEVELAEKDARYDLKVFSRFERVGNETRCVILMDVRLKGLYAVLAPLLGGMIRRRVERVFVEPMRSAMETGRLIA